MPIEKEIGESGIEKNASTNMQNQRVVIKMMLDEMERGLDRREQALRLLVVEVCLGLIRALRADLRRATRDPSSRS